MPTLDKNSACYILRSCLEREPAETVKGVDDDIIEMWKRLDEKYGDPAKLTDAIINTIQDIRPIKEGENKRFIELVDAVEDGYKDLKRLGLEREITTTSSVSIIERGLPANIKREWAKLVSADNSVVNKTDKFPSLLNFLLSQKRAIEYDTTELRLTTTSTIKGSAHYAKTDKDDITRHFIKMKKLKPLYKESPDPQVYVTTTSQTLVYCRYSESPQSAVGSMFYGIAELHSVSLQMTKQKPSD